MCFDQHCCTAFWHNLVFNCLHVHVSCKSATCSASMICSFAGQASSRKLMSMHLALLTQQCARNMHYVYTARGENIFWKAGCQAILTFSSVDLETNCAAIFSLFMHKISVTSIVRRSACSLVMPSFSKLRICTEEMPVFKVVHDWT